MQMVTNVNLNRRTFTQSWLLERNIDESCLMPGLFISETTKSQYNGGIFKLSAITPYTKHNP
jgi:hypothetical protein